VVFCNPTHSFKLLQIDPEADESELCDHLGIEVFPTLQFWRHGQLQWEHRGIAKAAEDLGEGEWGG
jgi:hypothetical protein